MFKAINREEIGLQAKIVAETVNDLEFIRIGDSKSRLIFINEITKCYEKLLIDAIIAENTFQFEKIVCNIADQIIEQHGELRDNISRLLQWVDESGANDRYDEAREELEALAIFQDDWRVWRADPFLPDFRKGPGRPPRTGPELYFAAEVAIAWQRSFKQPAGLGAEAAFMRFYRPLCERLGLKPFSRSVLKRKFKFLGKVYRTRIGADRRGRPKKCH